MENENEELNGNENENENEDINEIEDNLWLGNTFAAKNIEDLKKKGIKKILTVMNSSSDSYFFNEHGFIHKIIDILDEDYKNIIQYFGECIRFINGGEKVLVHCGAGASRSPTIVIAYLMWKNTMSFDDALKFVQKKRSIVCPNSGFKKQLKMFENILYENDYDIDKINFKNIKYIPPIDMYSSYY